MGVQAMVKGAIANMRKTNATNVQALEKWAKRALKIAKDLGGSDDTTRQHDLETAVNHLSKAFISAAGIHPDSLCTRIEPDIQKKREEILLEAEQMLDSFQDPPPGRVDDIRLAMREDAEQLKEDLEGLAEVPDGILQIVNEHAATVAPSYENIGGVHRGLKMSPERKAHAQITKKLHSLYENGIPEEPMIMVGVSDMNDQSDVDRYYVTFDDTFSDLVDVVLDSDDSALLPDFWCRRVDSMKNRVTESGVWWEWQHPKKMVADAIMESKRVGSSRSGEIKATARKGKGRFELKSVIQDGEYIVALVGTDGRESGTPICIPRGDRKPASEFLQQSIFPNQRVSRLLDLEDGTDVSNILFDNRNFIHKTNPLFIELDGNES